MWHGSAVWRNKHFTLFILPLCLIYRLILTTSAAVCRGSVWYRLDRLSHNWEVTGCAPLTAEASPQRFPWVRCCFQSISSNPETLNPSPPEREQHLGRSAQRRPSRVSRWERRDARSAHIAGIPAAVTELETTQRSYLSLSNTTVSPPECLCCHKICFHQHTLLWWIKVSGWEFTWEMSLVTKEMSEKMEKVKATDSNWCWNEYLTYISR